MEAKYRPNAHQSLNIERSSLILLLRDHPWIPQGNDSYSCPGEASQDQLPEGFPFDPGESWIKAIEFGKDIKKEVKKRRDKREMLGLNNDEELARVEWFAGLTQDEQEQMQSKYSTRKSVRRPQNKPQNKERRHAKITEEIQQAPKRRTDKRSRSIRIYYPELKKEAREYLRDQYTNCDAEMFCQICQEVLPFKLSNGKYYFEAVECLENQTKDFHWNYLALCPNHAAMYQHVNCTENREELFRKFFKSDENVLNVELAKKGKKIYFTDTHKFDLERIIE